MLRIFYTHTNNFSSLQEISLGCRIENAMRFVYLDNNTIGYNMVKKSSKK